MLSKKELVEQYGEYVNKIVFRMIRNRSLAQDVSQEVWLEVLNSIDSFNGESQLSTWIWTIASRTALKHSYKEKKLSHEQFEEYFNSPKEFLMEPTVHRELWVKEKCERCVTSFLRCLSHEDRLMMVLRDLLELEYAEVERITNKSSAAIRKQVSRSREKLKGYIDSVCPLMTTENECRCHIVREVSKTDVAETYAKLLEACNTANELVLLDKTFPSKNFWEKFI